MSNIKSTEGFRTDVDDLFKYEIAHVEHRKHPTPFILFLKDTVEAIYYTHTLLSKTVDDDVILKAWVGKWKTDVFAFTVRNLREYIEANNIRII